MDGYGKTSPFANKLLMPDGSVRTFGGDEVLPADEGRARQYGLAAPLANKVLNPDGSVSATLSAGGGGTAIIPEKWIFADEAARDAYFAANPDELEPYKTIALITGAAPNLLQQYTDEGWTDGSAAIRGEKGDKGDDGDGASARALTEAEFADAFGI
jgi:hypothetical protein